MFFSDGGAISGLMHAINADASFRSCFGSWGTLNINVFSHSGVIRTNRAQKVVSNAPADRARKGRTVVLRFAPQRAKTNAVPGDNTDRTRKDRNVVV